MFDRFGEAVASRLDALEKLDQLISRPDLLGDVRDEISEAMEDSYGFRLTNQQSIRGPKSSPAGLPRNVATFSFLNDDGITRVVDLAECIVDDNIRHALQLQMPEKVSGGGRMQPARVNMNPNFGNPAVRMLFEIAMLQGEHDDLMQQVHQPGHGILRPGSQVNPIELVQYNIAERTKRLQDMGGISANDVVAAASSLPDMAMRNRFVQQWMPYAGMDDDGDSDDDMGYDGGGGDDAGIASRILLGGSVFNDDSLGGGGDDAGIASRILLGGGDDDSLGGGGDDAGIVSRILLGGGDDDSLGGGSVFDDDSLGGGGGVPGGWQDNLAQLNKEIKAGSVHDTQSWQDNLAGLQSDLGYPIGDSGLGGGGGNEMKITDDASVNTFTPPRA